MKFAVVKTGGKQYKVTEGQTVNIEKLTGKEGEKIVFDEVLLAGDDQGDVQIGMPLLKAKVDATILKHDREDKITVIKYKRKIRYRRKIGHRQPVTQVKIEKIA